MRARSQRCFLSLVSVRTSQAECALDHDWSPPEPIWASHDRLFSRSTHRVCITCLPAADDRFTAVMTPISVDEFSFFGIVKDCQDFRLHGFVIPRIRFHTVVVAEECVHRVQQIRTLGLHWHEHVVVLRVCFLRQSSFDILVCNRGCSLFC